MAGVISTRTVTVNAAFLQEIKEVNEELWQLLDELRHCVRRPIGPGHCRLLVERLATLRDQVALHFALEEAYGYFEDPAYVQPNLGEAAEKLRREHQSLYVWLTNLVERAEQMSYDVQLAELSAWIGPQFEKFDAALRDHESRENDLIMDALEMDIGGEN
jgi:hypothetical protein